MAAQNPPYALQTGFHGAELFRRMLKASSPVAGIVATGDLAVTANGTPNMSVNVAAGEAVVHGSENTAQGSYYVRNDATLNLSIAASDPTNPRNDLVVAKVQDAAYSGATNAWSLAVVTGTPAASPADPATPANAIVLARVRVDAAVTSVVAGKITDLRPKSTALTAPLGILGYAQVTSLQSGITTEVDITGLSVSVAVGTNRRIKITAQLSAASSVTDDVGEMYIKEGSTRLQSSHVTLRNAAALTMTAVVLVSPSSGSHTYKISFARVGSGTANTSVGVNDPGLILVEDVGPA